MIGSARMPKKADPTKKIGSVYESQIKATEKWNANNPTEKLILRLPEGMRDRLNDYVATKAAEEPGNRNYSTDKGRPSVNAFLISLIEREIGTDSMESSEEI